MIKPACLRAGSLLDGRAAGLSPVAALRLEEHMAGCAECSREAGLLDALTGLSDQAAAPLPQATRERVIAAAFARGAAREPMRSRPRVPPASLGWALGLAASALIALLAGSYWRSFGAHAASAHLISGQLSSAGLDVERGALLGERAQLQSRHGAVAALAHAQVELRPGTRADWDGATRELRLRSGSVVVEVDPTRKQSFTVQTDRWRVQVLGTRFEVEQGRVRVLHGRVLVLANDGHELARLQAGQAYAEPPSGVAAPVGDLNGAAAPIGDPSGAPAAHGSDPARPDADGEAPAPAAQTAPGAGEPSQKPAPASLDGQRARRAAAARSLDQARSELAARRVASARALIDAALRAGLANADEAEALSLRADCFLVAGDVTAAVSGYRSVAARFARLPAGENALFAAARLEAEGGAHTLALELLRSYLERYPRGRFVKEVRARLTRLQSPGQAR